MSTILLIARKPHQRPPAQLSFLFLDNLNPFQPGNVVWLVWPFPIAAFFWRHWDPFETPHGSQRGRPCAPPGEAESTTVGPMCCIRPEEVAMAAPAASVAHRQDEATAKHG